MQRTMVPGVSMWSRWQPERGVFFNSYLIESGEENFIIDPLALDEGDVTEIERLGGAAWVVVTNRDHERDAAAVSRRFDAKIAASEGDAALMQCAVERTLREGDRIGPFSVVILDGMKTPEELALRYEAARTVIVGDAIWGAPAGALSLPPNVGDRERALLSVRRLREGRPRHLLVGDGSPVFGRAFEALNAFLEAQEGMLAARVNLDELRFTGSGRPAGYRCRDAEIGHLLGASVLGCQAALLPPGESFCPFHWHTVDEELFIVWEGTPLLRTPQGQTRLRRGDLVAFPANENGAHRLYNDGNTDCVVLMIASNEKSDDVCCYPDSKKLMVSAAEIIVRAEPTLEYFAGET